MTHVSPRRASALAAALFVLPALLSAQPAQPAKPIDRLKTAIERITRSVNATWGIYVKSLDTGEELALDADRQMETMSTIKIPLMIEAFEQIKAGTFALTDKYTYAEADTRGGTGIIRSLSPGAVLTVKDLLTLMIIVSDNTATDVLYRLVGGIEPVKRRMEAYGLTKTYPVNIAKDWFDAIGKATSRDDFYRTKKFPFGQTTPREMGMLLERMERGTLVDKASSDLMLQMMRGQLYRTRIPRYLSDYRVPHKTGDFLPYVADDVGMLEGGGKTIVLSIYTNDHYGSGEVLENAIGLVAKEVGDYFGYR